MQTPSSATPAVEPSSKAIDLATMLRLRLGDAAAEDPNITATDQLDAIILALAAEVANRTQLPPAFMPDAALYRVQIGTRVMEWSERYHEVMQRTQADAASFLANRNPDTIA